jgi:High potential iron-sulfur protein
MFTARKNSSAHSLNEAASMGVGRRQLLQSALVTLIGAVGIVAKARAATCASPDAGDASLRASLHYVESSPNPAQRCSGCSFFSDPKGDCGKCMIFNAPANLSGHCDSWSART